MSAVGSSSVFANSSGHFTSTRTSMVTSVTRSAISRSNGSRISNSFSAKNKEDKNNEVDDKGGDDDWF